MEVQEEHPQDPLSDNLEFPGGASLLMRAEIFLKIKLEIFRHDLMEYFIENNKIFTLKYFH